MSKKGGGAQVTKTVADPEVLARFRAASNQPYSESVPGYRDNLNAATGTTGTGLGALGGDQASIQKLWNPYQQNVLDAHAAAYDRMRSQAALGVNDEATRAGAFGGSRQALTIGERQGAIDQQQMQDDANLRYQGYGAVQNQAAQGANLGLNASQYYGGLSQEQRDWALRNARVLQEAYGQGAGTSQPTSQNLGGKIAGGAAAGGAIGGPIGAGIGGGLGLLGIL